MEYVYSDRVKNLGGNAIREIFKLLQDRKLFRLQAVFLQKQHCRQSLLRTLPTS